MKILFIFLCFIYIGVLNAQYDYQCGMPLDAPLVYPRGYQFNPPQIGGKNAPAKTLNGAYLRIFCVFAQFVNDTKDSNDTNWPINQLPVWATSFIGTNINQAPFLANTISNYFYEMSNGQNIIIGDVYPSLVLVNLSNNTSYGEANEKVLHQIDPYVNFQNYDQWQMLADYQQTFNQTDNYVDAVYIIWRNLIHGWGGIADLGISLTTNDGVKIWRYSPTIGMTLNIGANGNYTFQNKLACLSHEYGHYLFGGFHNFENNYYYFMPDGTIQRGLALMNANSGGGIAMNPQEKYLLGYTTYTDIFYDQSGTLPDYYTTGVAYRIPIPTHINGQPNTTPDEFFAIANYQQTSPYDISNNQGIYIYHVKSNYYGHNHIDLITADGLWEWEVIGWVPRPNGYGSPANWARYNFSPPALFPVISKVEVDRVNGRDELQEVVHAQYPGQNYYWWDRYLDDNGNPNNAVVPIDSKPWTMGYNQVFSPWSNPPVFDKNRNPVYAAVELISSNNGNFNLQFYVGQNNCLSTTPAKPQNLRVSGDVYEEVVLTWDANVEPDIISGGKYKIYRAEIWGTSEPTSWDLIAQIDAYNGSIPVASWVDYESSAYTGPKWLHYKISALDNTLKESVPSDKVKINGRIPKENSGNESDKENIKYDLIQNFPNPFNPTTNIRFSIPQAGAVSLVVYNLVGEKVVDLVNGLKEAGEYNVNLDGSKLSSGTYIYTLSVNGNVISKKLTLLK